MPASQQNLEYRIIGQRGSVYMIEKTINRFYIKNLWDLKFTGHVQINFHFSVDILWQPYLWTKVRNRYWARNYVGYQYFSIREPNENHIQINNLEEAGHIKHLITQNVDGLHIKAGSRNLVELHGNSHRAFCLNCKKLVSRAKMQVWMKGKIL